MSAERYRSVVIAMAIMWVMQPSVHKVIDVITVRHLFVSAAPDHAYESTGYRACSARGWYR